MLAVAQVFAQSPPWTPPGNPPECLSTTLGCNAPINVGRTLQTKDGSLAITNGMLSVPIFQLTGNGAASDKILRSDGSGVASWGNLIVSEGPEGPNEPFFDAFSVNGSVGGSAQKNMGSTAIWSACFLTGFTTDNTSSSRPACKIVKSSASSSWILYAVAGSSDTVHCYAMCIRKEPGFQVYGG